MEVERRDHAAADRERTDADPERSVQVRQRAGALEVGKRAQRDVVERGLRAAAALGRLLVAVVGRAAGRSRRRVHHGELRAVGPEDLRRTEKYTGCNLELAV